MAKSALQEAKMAARIRDREDNLYKKEMIKDVLSMYADEIRKAMLNGERVQITKVGTLIPEIKTHIGNYSMPTCNNFNGNPPPYTRIRMTRSYSLREAMNRKLLQNIKEGIYGLLKLPFSKQQIGILKSSGYISEDVEVDCEEEE